MWRRVKNADLWKELHSLVESRANSPVTMSKIKGHASLRDVRRRLVRMQDKEGNDAADALATAGAASHALPMATVHRTLLRRAVAEDTQRLMLDVLGARSSHANALRQQQQMRVRREPNFADGSSQASSPSFVICSASLACPGSEASYKLDSSHSSCVHPVVVSSTSSDGDDLWISESCAHPSEPVRHVIAAPAHACLTQHPIFSGSDHPT